MSATQGDEWQSFSLDSTLRNVTIPEVLIKMDQVYKYIELTGVSDKSWEKAIDNAITKASTSLRDMRVAEVITQDVRIENNKIAEYRVRLKLSFKYEKE